MMVLADDIRTRLASVPPLDVIGSPSRRNLSYADFTFDKEQNLLGRGGNAVVYEARVPKEDLTVALKRPFPDKTVPPETTDRLLEEAKKWAGIDDHPYVAGVVESGLDGISWIAIEYLDAGPLTDHIGELAVPQRLWTAYAIAAGVAHANKRGLYHFDLKPANVLLQTMPGEYWSVPKVADWGLSRELIQHDGSISQATPEYAAPEQFAAIMPDAPVDEQTDVYQLGVVCYELLTGRHPNHLQNDVKPPSDVDSDLPEAVDGMLKQALAHDRDARYEHTIYVRDALGDLIEAELLDGEPFSSQAKSIDARTDRPKEGIVSYPADTDVTSGQTEQDKQESSTIERLSQEDHTAENSGIHGGDSESVNNPPAVQELSSLDRITAEEAENLVDSGVTSVETLAEADESDLSTKLDRGVNEVARWIGEAKSHTVSAEETRDRYNSNTNSSVVSMEGSELASLSRVTEEEAKNLIEVGIEEVEDLADASDVELADKLNRGPNEVARWIGEAKSHASNKTSSK